MENIQTTVEVNEPERNSSIELLRIIIMLMIIGSHFAKHGGFSFDNHAITIPQLWCYVLEMGGNFGVDVFVLISGYFLIENKSLRVDIKKIFKLWGQLFFYSFALFIFAFIIGRGTTSLKSIVKLFFPVTFPQWWFASTYFVMFLLHPYLNRLILSFDKGQYQKFLLYILFIWSFIPTLTASSFQSNPLIEFLMYYSISGYIRLYGFKQSFNSRQWLALWFCFSLLTYLSRAVFMIIGTKYVVFANHAADIYRRQSLLVVFSAISFFMAFATHQMKYSRFINTIASATFGVYLLHDSNLLRQYLWIDIFHNASYQNTAMLIPYSIIVIFVVFALCAIVDLGRRKLLEKKFLKLIDACKDKLSVPFEKATAWLKSFVFDEKAIQ